MSTSRGQRALSWGRVSLAVTAILVLVVVPGVLAYRSEFFARYPALETRYRTWAISTHAEAPCRSCHLRPAPLAEAVYPVRLLGAFYVSLVSRTNPPNVFASPTNEACLSCHSDLRSVSPKGDLQIPHKAHVNVLEMRCVQCHKYLVHERSHEGKHDPPMRLCLECHDGDTAEDACTACHTSKAAPRSHTRTDWLVVHPVESTTQDCASCHGWREDWCVECHRDRPRSHGNDWRAVHGNGLDKHRSCEACHKPSFCVRCHGVYPARGIDPGLRLVE